MCPAGFNWFCDLRLYFERTLLQMEQIELFLCWAINPTARELCDFQFILRDSEQREFRTMFWVKFFILNLRCHRVSTFTANLYATIISGE